MLTVSKEELFSRDAPLQSDRDTQVPDHMQVP